jgi:hypothetical protein
MSGQEAMSKTAEPRPVGGVARWLMPSLRSYTALVVLTLLIRESWRFLKDGDTGWHIRTGEWILETGSAPRHDLFSYTMQGRDWFAWEWLTDVLMAMAHQRGGLAMLVALAICVLLTAFFILHFIMMKRGADPVIALIVTSFGAVATIVHWLARPHLLSILFMVIWYALVEDFHRNRSRGIYLVPFIVVLWANLHGAFVVTIPLLVIYAVGEIIEFGWRGELRSPALRAAVRVYILIGAGSLLAGLATPYGYRLFIHLWKYLSDRELLAAISEFQSPNFHLADGKLIEVLLILGLVSAGLALKRGRVVESGLVILLGHMTIQSERHVTMAVVLITPIIAEELTRLIASANAMFSEGGGNPRRIWKKVSDRYGRFAAIDRQLSGIVVYPIAILFVLLVAKGPLAERYLSPRFDPKIFPVGAADHVLANPPSGHLYAHDGFSGYLIYRLYPKVQVFVDGRSDLYRASTVLDDMSALSIKLKPTWQEILDRYNVTWMLLRRDEPLALIAEMSGKWATTYQDETAQILIRK